MTKKIKTESEFPGVNEVNLLRTTLSELKVKLPGLDIFLLANPECTKCSNSKDYHCVQLKGKPGCRTCTTRRISCSRHVQYLVETAASRLEWSVEKTKFMYDKHVKQTRSGKKSKAKKVPTSRMTTGSSRIAGSDSAADHTVAGGRSEWKRNVAAEGDESEYYQSDEELSCYNQDDDTLLHREALHSISKASTSSSHLHAVPSGSQEETTTSHSHVTIPVLEPEKSSPSGPGLRDSISLLTDSGKTATVQPVDDLTQREDEPVQTEPIPESSMSAEQRIKELEVKVAKLNALRRIDAVSISRLTKKADTAFDNMSVLLSRVHMHRQELDMHITKYIEPAHQKPFKSLIDKMDETSVSATQILILLDKRKNYAIPKDRVPVGITDEDGHEWVPWDVISDDNIGKEKKRKRVNGAGEGSSKRRKS